MTKPVAVAAAGPPRLIENRNIIIGVGLQFRASPLPDLAARVPGLIVDVTGDSALYYSKAQGVNFKLTVVRKKGDFKTALETPGAHVVYCAHSRYGRGCCFGDTLLADGSVLVPGATVDKEILPLPGDDWEEGSIGDTGLFRMGWKYVAIPVDDIVEHGYKFHPVPASVTLDPAQCHPDIRAGMGSLTAMALTDSKVTSVEQTTLTKIASEVSADAGTSPHHMVEGVVSQSGGATTRLPLIQRAYNLDGSRPVNQQYWYFGGRNGARGAVLPQLVLYAGWKDTTSAPMELDKANMQCRVFTHLGCSSMFHNQPIVRTQKNWTQQGNEGYSFFTTGPSFPTYTAVVWLAAVLTYNKYNAGQSWKASLTYATQQASGELAGAGMNYRIV